MRRRKDPAEETSWVSPTQIRSFLVASVREKTGFRLEETVSPYFLLSRNKATATSTNYSIVEVIKIDRNYYKYPIRIAPTLYSGVQIMSFFRYI